MAIVVKVNRKYQSILKVIASPKKNPDKDFNVTITKEVPMAFFILSLVKITSAGMIKNPPPAPTSSVIAPIILPLITTNG